MDGLPPDDANEVEKMGAKAYIKQFRLSPVEEQIVAGLAKEFGDTMRRFEKELASPVTTEARQLKSRKQLRISSRG